MAATIGRNTVFGIGSRLAQVLTRLVTVPIIIAHLGLDGYGIWSIIMTTAGYMRFGSVGIKSAFQKYVAEATGNGDYETANRLLSTGCGIMLVLSVAGLIPSALFSHTLAQWAGVPPEFLYQAAGSISVLALIMMLSNVGAAYEAIVMGGHRIDLARNFTTFFTVAEAVAIVILLHFGYGLLAMASVMAASEVGFILCCYVAAKRIVPQVRVGREFITPAVVKELVRFAGSYQLVNIMEVLYVAILPITVLRTFGAETAGVYALATRLVQSAQMLPDAFLLPILSGGAMVYASGSAEQMRRLMSKSFKVTLGLSLFPLAFMSVFGATIVFAWTGAVDSTFHTSLWLVCLAGLFQAFSMLALVLYRTSGRALHDNLRQVLRIITLLSIALFARNLGFHGVLSGLALAELVGMIFMLFALARTFKTFTVSSLLPDAIKLTIANAVVLAIGLLVSWMPLPAMANIRLESVLRLALICLVCALAAWPVLRLTRSVTGAEGKALLQLLLPRLYREPGAEVFNQI